MVERIQRRMTRFLTILALIALGLWLPVAVMDAMQLQAAIDAGVLHKGTGR